ncbi:MAG: phage portal protein, partial [Tepidisphaeraceae bacterium]
MRFPFRITRNRLAVVEAKAYVVNSLTNWGQHLMGGTAYSEQAAYGTHPWVYRCVRITEQALAGIPLKTYRKGDKRPVELLSGPITDSFQYPNESTSQRELIESMVNALQLCGNALIALVPVGSSTLLLPLNPRRVTLARDGDVLQGYEYHAASGKATRLRLDEVVHVKYQSDEDPLWGIGPLQAARKSYQDDQLMRQHNRTILQNGGIPPRVVITTEQNLTSDQIKENLMRWRETHAGPQNAGNPALLTGGFQLKDFGLSQQDLDFIESQLKTMREVCTVFGVPSSKMNDGISDASNHRSMERAFLNDTVLPLCATISDQINNQMWKLERRARFMPSETYVRFDTSQVPELVRERQELEEADRLNVRDGISTINRVLTSRGEDPVAWGDV